ncbi:TolC family protein [Sulfurimonas sp.]|uniref:TolC family protein n=1 Tax=Sulfurimonas sp. TaxID=2022749 RepID=UPI00262F139B|nr:TolC family protein [Sulfurimonas sp.]
MKAFKLLVLLCLSSSSFIFANENNASLDKFISDYKNKQFEYDYEKSEAEGSKLRDSWIAPLRLNYSYSKSNPFSSEQLNENASIRMDQPIFQSGGIYYGIKFANASKLYNDVSIDVAKRKMIKDAIAILMQIKQTGYREKKQKLQIKNSEINLAQKKEQYLNGQLDSGFLDNAIIQKNIVTEALYDIQTNKERLINRLKALSDVDYKKANVLHLDSITREEFLGHNIVLQKSDAEIEKNRYAKEIRVAKYLPSINLTAGYNWQKTSNQVFQVGQNFVNNSNELNFYDYGFKASLPIDLNTFKDIESAKVDYLKSQVVRTDKERELRALYNQVMQNIENFNKKIKLSKENKKLYAKLLKDTNKLYAAGYKTKYDVDTLSNSLKIQTLDTKIYEMDKQLELLNLYEMYLHDKK